MNVRRLIGRLRRRRFDTSQGYWERRYASGGNSGAGSYGQVAIFKAEVLNALVKEHQVATVVELGCGDGHQLSLADYPRYVGLDVSTTVLEQCRERFAGDETKDFRLYDADALDRESITADLAISLDVILHLVEDDVYESYMRHLFAAGERFVVIFSPDRDDVPTAEHVRYRRFTPWVDQNAPAWSLLSHVENPHSGPDSLADFYMYAHR
jgi:cyclopropane fatty-acyl-phospholipid synthase-like methyltransferase